MEFYRRTVERIIYVKIVEDLLKYSLDISYMLKSVVLTRVSVFSNVFDYVS